MKVLFYVDFHLYNALKLSIFIVIFIYLLSSLQEKGDKVFSSGVGNFSFVSGFLV